MSAEIGDVMRSFVETLAGLNLNGAPILCIMLACSAVVCLEGIKIYKMALALGGFVFGFLFVREAIGERLQGDGLLVVEVGAGLLLAILSWRLYLAGVALIVFLLAREFLGDKIEGSFAVLICIAASALVALLSIKLNRAVIVIVTAVAGAFAMVEVFLLLIPVFPVDLSFFPPASSQVWVWAKLFLSAAGVGIQDVREPAKRSHG